MTLVSIYVIKIVKNEDSTYHRISQLETDFAVIITEEKDTLANRGKFNALNERYGELARAIVRSGFKREKEMLTDRLALIETL